MVMLTETKENSCFYQAGKKAGLGIVLFVTLTIMLTYFVIGVICADIVFKSDGYQDGSTSIDAFPDDYRGKLRAIAGIGIAGILAVLGMMIYAKLNDGTWAEAIMLGALIGVVISMCFGIAAATIAYNYNRHDGKSDLERYYDPADGRYSEMVEQVIQLLPLAWGHFGLAIVIAGVYVTINAFRCC